MADGRSPRTVASIKEGTEDNRDLTEDNMYLCLNTNVASAEYKPKNIALNQPYWPRGNAREII